MPDFGPDLVEVFGPSQADGGPELIQLLTPEGERVHHPAFDQDFSAEQLRGFYRDMVLTRRIDTEAGSSAMARRPSASASSVCPIAIWNQACHWRATE